MKRISIFGVICLTLLMGACAPRVTSYYDPSYQIATYSSVKPLQNPIPAHVSLEFQTNGKRNQEATQVVYEKIIRVLRASRVFEPAKDSNSNLPRLEFIMNDIFDKSAAYAKGFGTGMTFGAVGSTVVDKYEFSAKYIPVNGSPFISHGKDAIHTVIGNKIGRAHV